MANDPGSKSAASHNAFLAYNARIERARLTDFARLGELTYLDHAGSALYGQRQLRDVFRDLEDNVYGNPHSGSGSAQLTSELVEVVRCRVLDHFNTSSAKYSVIFTSGCTDALKLIAYDFRFRDEFDPSYSTAARDAQTSVRTTARADVARTTSASAAAAFASDDANRPPTSEDRNGRFFYLQDNHTSVLGMRGAIADRAVPVTCLASGGAVRAALLRSDQSGGNRLLAFPAQSNFCGAKYPLAWIRAARYRADGKRSNWYVLLDAAAFVATSPLDLTAFRPDFVSISFYKMFGFPTGLGALLVRNSSAHVLEKKYFGGGTIKVALSEETFQVFRSNISERFEDGTIPFLDIIALRHGFDSLKRIAGSMRDVSQHTFRLARRVRRRLATLRHGNGVAVVTAYCDGDYDDVDVQGPILAFNLRRPDNSYMGYAQVETLAQLWNIQFRTGCFCNMGACQHHLAMTAETIRKNFKAGHVCGDDNDLVEGQPTGCIRISFGYCSTMRDAQTFIRFIESLVQNDIVPTDGLEIDQGSGHSDNSEIGVLAKEEMDAEIDDEMDDEIDAEIDAEINDEIDAEIDEKADNKTNDVMNEIDDVVKNEMKIDDGETRKSGAWGTEDGDGSGAGTEAGRVGSEEDGAIVEKDAAILKRIFLYPVKSCAAFEVMKWPITEKGLAYDRQWMIVDESGASVGLKRSPQMCKIKPIVDEQQGILILNFPGVQPISVFLVQPPEGSTDSRLCTSRVCADRILSCDCGDDVASWLQTALGRSGIRLVHQNSADVRTAKKKSSEAKDAGKLSFVNEAQYLLVNVSSIKMLQRHLASKNEISDLDNLTRRFRANLVVDSSEPFEESDWTSLTIGEQTFLSQGSCQRCQVICIDQSTGERSKEPFTSLMRFRDGTTKFGILLQHAPVSGCHVNRLSVGDAVVPTRRQKTH